MTVLTEQIEEALIEGGCYSINLSKLCEFDSFEPSQVVSCEMVWPRGAVPNAQLLWFKVELQGERRKFVTRPLSEFHALITLPQSSIGGWTDGDVGQDHVGLHARYAVDDPGDSDEA